MVTRKVDCAPARDTRNGCTPVRDKATKRQSAMSKRCFISQWEMYYACVYQPVSPDLFGVIEFCRVCNPDFGTIQPVCQTLSVSYCYSLNFVHTLQVYSPPGIRLYFGQGTGQLIICRVSVPINCPMSSKYAVTF